MHSEKKTLCHVNMQRFCWPGHKMQLLGGLQKLQKSNEFCDTLLQTEGISVPTHSCVLAALSPYLSEKLSASPSPPSGQRHQVQLHALNAQTLLKLVGLLYSGELEVKGSVEQNDVLAAAHQFGIANLVEEQKDGGMSQWSCGEHGFCAQGSRGRDERRKMKDAQVQAEMGERRETDSLGEKRSCVSTGTQTVTAGENSADSSVTLSSQATPAAPESTPCGAQTSMHNGASSEGEPTSNQPFGSLTNSSLEFGESVQVLSEERTKLDNEQRDNRDDREQLVQANGDDTAAAERQKCTEKEHGDVSVGITQATQISVKVKLRRKTEGEMWEVVNIPDSHEMSALVSLREDGCHHERPDKSLSNSLSPPSTHGPDCHILQPPKSPPHLNTTPDPQPPSGESVTPNQTSGHEAAPPLQHQCPVEDSDEQIEKLLEDIMMGLNILPALDRDSNKSQYLQQSHSRVKTVPQVPGPQNDMGHSQIAAGLSSAGCVQYQDLETQSDKSSADKGIHSRLTAQNQLSCTSLSSAVSAGVLQLQQQECVPQNHSSIRSMWQMDGKSQQSAPLLKSQECLHPEPPTIRSVTPGALFSTGQKLHYPALHQVSSLDNQHILQFLPLNNETYSHTLYLPCTDDLRLPRCLSPLNTYTSSTKYQLAPNISTNLGMKNQQKPSRHGPPWLTENPGSLDSSLSAVSVGENKSASLPQDTTWCSWQENQALNPKSCVAKDVKEGQTVSASQQNASGLKSDRGRMKKGDTTGDAVAPKRRKRTHPSKPQDAAGSVLAYKDVRDSDAINSHINLSICQVSLSSNNVLAKERQMANSSKSVEEQNQPSSITESLGEKTRGCRMNTCLTPIRTRGFMKKAQELNDLSPETYLFAKPVAHCMKMVNKEGVRKRKRGRPPKKQHEGPASTKSHPSVFEKKNHREENQQKTDNTLTKEESQNKGKTRKRCKRRRISRSRNTDFGVIALNSTTSIESTSKPDGKVEIVKRSHMVTLKDFKSLIKRQRSKMMSSKKSQETNETVRDGQNESQVTVDKNHNLISNQLTGGMKRMLQDNNDSSTRMETSVTGENPSEFSIDVLEEDMSKTAAEREQPLKSADEGTTCNTAESDTAESDTAESDTAQKAVISDEGLSRSDTRLPQEIKLPSHPILHLQSPLEDARGSSRTLSCNDEEEEVEVDVLLYSPVKVPQTREGEDGLGNIEVSPDDEEEEDEIDVTGDESQ